MGEAKYIVKSASRIQGPFSLEELAAQVSRRELSMLDEVRTPDNRWSFVREIPSFKELIEQLRSEEIHFSDQTQSSVTLTSRTNTAITTTSSAHLDSEAPDPLVSINAREKTIAPGVSSSSYGSITDKRVQQRMRASQKRRNLFILVLAGAVLGFAVYTLRPGKPKGPNRAQIVEFAKYAEELARVGRYPDALALLVKDERNAFLTPEQQILKAKLYLQATPQVVEVKRMLDGLQTIKEEQTRGQVTLIRALIAVRERRWMEADQGFRSLMGNRFLDLEAKMNVAVLRYLTGNTVGTLQALAQIPARSPLDNYAKLLKGMSVLMERNPGASVPRADAVAEELLREAGESRENRFELTLVGAALMNKAGRKEDVRAAIERLRDIDPFASRNFISNLSIEYAPLAWETFGEICDHVAALAMDSTAGPGLRAECKFLQGQEGAAVTLIEQARRQYSTDLKLAAVHALLLKQSNRALEAKSLIQFLEGKESLLGELVMSDICLAENDWGCVERRLQTVRSLDPMEPLMFYGLGLLAKQRSQNEVVRDLVSQGLRLYPRYRPLLDLRGDAHGF